MPKYSRKRNRTKQVTGERTNGDSSKGHVNGIRGAGYPDIIKENASFERFYKAQKIVPEEEWEQFVNSLKESLPTTFRITGYKSHASALLGIIKSQYFNDITKSDMETKPKPLPWYPQNLGWQLNMSRTVIRKSESLAKLHTFLVTETESGNISRQEAVSMIPPLVLDVQTHHKVLDMCAAPGSKTAQLIEMLHADEETIPEGFVVANDMDNRRCYMLVHQAKRLQSPCFIITNHDASLFPNIKTENENGKIDNMLFDRVLCDVPCSGDGTMRKNYEVWKKWNVANPNNLHHIQLRILKRGLELLNVGGRLVYSTCSLNPIENEAVIAETLRLCEGSIELVDVRDRLPGLKVNPGLYTWKVMNRQLDVIESPTDIPEKDQTQIKLSMFPPSTEEAQKLNLEQCLRILPHHQDTGCFFVAVIHKKAQLPWQKVSEDVKDKENGESEEIPDSVTFSRKRRKMMGYKEDPFFFFEEEDPAWLELKNLYQMENFPDKLLLTRCNTGKKRNIYFVSKIVKNVLKNNEGRIKVINSGLRLFCRSDNKGTACGFRVTQEGVATVMPFMKTRKLEVSIEDIGHLLTTEYPSIDNMTDVTRSTLDETETGSIIIILNTTDLEGNPLKVQLCGWKGKASLRCYVPRGERLHYLRLCNIDISKYEVNPNKKFKIKDGDSDPEAKVEKEIDEPDCDKKDEEIPTESTNDDHMES